MTFVLRACPELTQKLKADKDELREALSNLGIVDCGLASKA
jgi:hypothetical protein